MTRDCADVTGSTSLNDAAHLMWAYDCGALPVVDSSRAAVGMVTDRDLCMCAYHEGRSLKELKVADAMSDRIVTCKEDDEVAKAQRIMSEAQVRRLPVVNSAGRLSGVLALAQIARAGSDEQAVDVAKEEVTETLAAISTPHVEREPLAR